MKLEFLSDESSVCPLIRLYDFTPAEAAQLLAAVTALADLRAQRVAIHELPGVEPVGGCRLTLRVRSWDQGVTLRTAPADFEYGLIAGTWDNVAGLVAPFTESAGGFQWLDNASSEVRLLLSPDGSW